MHYLNDVTRRLHQLTWQPGMFMHDQWWHALGLREWQSPYRTFVSLRKSVDALILARLNRSFTPLPVKLDPRQLFMMSQEDKLTRLCLALGLVACSCPDYLYTREYRQYITPVLGAQGCEQFLSVFHFSGNCPPQTDPQNILDYLLNRGTGWLNADHSGCAVWNALSLTLPPCTIRQDAFTETAYPWFHRFGRFL